MSGSNNCIRNLNMHFYKYHNTFQNTLDERETQKAALRAFSDDLTAHWPTLPTPILQESTKSMSQKEKV